MSEITTGICRYCHQIRTIEHVKEGFTQEEKDEIASTECDCEGAKEARNIEYQIDKGKTAIERIAGKDKNVATILRAGLRPIAEGAIQSIQVKTGSGMKYQIAMKKNIIVKSTETLEEESDGETTE